MSDLVVLVPVLRRPHRVKPLLDSIRATTPGDPRVLFIADPTDFEEQRAIHDEGGELLLIDGNYAKKINAGVRVTNEPLIFLGADDLNFHAGWLEAAVAELQGDFGVIGTNDLCNRRVMDGEHSTHSLVARWYTALGTIDDPSRLLHEGYPHEFVDDEFVETAKRRGAYAHAHDSLVEHLHPMVGKAPMDELYAGQRHRMRSGRRIFHSRRPLWT